MIPMARARAQRSDTISKLDVNKCPDVSISYCFICLLHLANEKNLAILGEA